MRVDGIRVGMRGVRVALLAVALCAVPGAALAHAKLVKSDPARRAVLAKPPSAVRLWFNETLEPAFSNASVHGVDGSVISAARAQVARDDPKRLELALPALPPGEYAVKYQVLSVDGHTVKSGFSFTVRAAPAAP